MLKLWVERLLIKVRSPSHYGTLEKLRLQSIVVLSEIKHMVFMSIQTAFFSPVGPHCRHWTTSKSDFVLLTRNAIGGYSFLPRLPPLLSW